MIDSDPQTAEPGARDKATAARGWRESTALPSEQGCLPAAAGQPRAGLGTGQHRASRLLLAEAGARGRPRMDLEPRGRRG